MTLFQVDNINWDAVSSISNIFLSIITLIAVFVTYRALVVSTKIKAKISYKLDRTPGGVFHRIRLVNQRDVPITIIHKGFYIVDDKSREVILKGKKVHKKIYNSDIMYFSVHEKELNAILRRRGYENGAKINLYGYFMTSNNGKMYKYKIKHRITESKKSIQIN